MNVALPSKPFRVIVIGGGISGLSLSHALQRANIDHIVLEKHAQVVSEVGAAVVVWPHVCRILDQFGCLEEFGKVCKPIQTEYRRLPNGRALAKTAVSRHLQEIFGYQTLVLDRHMLVKTLYDKLPDKSRIVTRRQVTSIVHTEHGIRVFTADGSVEDGDIVIGADGVHSLSRGLMWQHANAHSPTISITEKTSFVTTYKCLFGASGSISGLGSSELHICHHRGFSFFISTQPGRVNWAIFHKNREKTCWPTRVKYTDRDAEDLAAQMMAVPITELIVFGELWNSRIRSGLVSLEEGVMDHWHSGRIVLVGDAVHKMTPDIGLGGACGIEDTVVLSNILQNELTQPNHKSNSHRLNQLFKVYQDNQKGRARELVVLSGNTTRLHSWDSLAGFIFTYLMVPFKPDLVATIMERVVRSGRVLEYAPVSDVRKGRMQWTYPVDQGSSIPSYGDRQGLGTKAFGVCWRYIAFILIAWCVVWITRVSCSI